MACDDASRNVSSFVLDLLVEVEVLECMSQSFVSLSDEWDLGG